MDSFLVSSTSVATLGDACPVKAGNKLEGLFGIEIKSAVVDHFNLSRKPDKKDYALYFQELGAKGVQLDVDALDAETKSTMNSIASFILEKLDPLF